MGKSRSERIETARTEVELSKENIIEERKPEPVQRTNRSKIKQEQEDDLSEKKLSSSTPKINAVEGIVAAGDEAISAEIKPIARKRRKLNEEILKNEKGIVKTEENISKNTNKIVKNEEGIVDNEESRHEDKFDSTNPKRRRKTKEEREIEAMPLVARSAGLQMFVGAHVSAAKGVQNAVTNCVHIGGNAFALFLKSQRKWENPPLQNEHKTQFKAFCAEHNYDANRHVLPHGSYLVNLAQEDAEKSKQAYTAFLDDLHRCESLGIKLYNFHPGAAGSSSRESAIARIATHLNAAHAATSSVVPLLETMAGGGTVLGSTFADLADIITLVHDKSRIGVCLDTCHVFAAGYDLRTPAAFAATLAAFDRTVGLRYLKALHLNDSKAPMASHRDLHANIGTGFLGLGAFWNVLNEPRFEGLPMVLETPIDEGGGDAAPGVEDKGVWAAEIKLLERLMGMDRAGAEFRDLEAMLARRGEGLREKGLEAFERKVEKERKAGKGKAKGKKKKVVGGEGEGSE